MAEYIDRENYCAYHCGCDKRHCDKESCPLWCISPADVENVTRCENCCYVEDFGEVLYCHYWRKNTTQGGYCHVGG